MTEETKLKIVYRATSGLVPYARNSRTHSPSQVAQIAASVKSFGWTNPVLIDESGGIVAGHGRVMAAQLLGMKRVPCIVLVGLTETQRRAYVIADNRIALNAGWDDAMLAVEFAALREEHFDLELTGFELGEIETIEQEAKPEPPGDPDETPDPPATPVSRLGDLWILGKHRILCGDSTKAEDIARLMDGKRAGLMNTDPPYGVSYENDDRPNPGVAKPRVAKPRVANDGLTDEKLQAFLETCFRAAVEHALTPNAAWYLWHAHLTQGFFAAAAAAANVVLHRQIIWVKPVLLLGRGQYHWKHEPCFMGWVEGHQPPDYGEGHGERTQTTVWEIAGVPNVERKELNHSTPKPVGLFDIPIVKHLNAGEIAYEPFSGSGPQIIAAEKNGRRCFAIELEPRFVDTAIIRWQKYTNAQAALEDGRTFAEVKAERLP